MRVLIKLRGECHGILAEQPYNIFAVVKREVVAQESLAAANVCASQHSDMQNNYFFVCRSRLLRTMRWAIKS
jgi:hypothetical protein